MGVPLQVSNSTKDLAYKNQIDNKSHWLEMEGGLPLYVSNGTYDLAYKNQIYKNIYWPDMGRGGGGWGVTLYVSKSP